MTAYTSMISAADRIIICGDDEEAGWDDLWQIQRYYEHHGKIYLRSNRAVQGVEYFGTNEQIFTVNQIVRTRLNDAARTMNDLYRRSVEDSLDWEELDDRLRQSKIAVADHLFMKMRVLLDETVLALDKGTCIAAYESLLEAQKKPDEVEKLRRIEHARWMRFYSYYNWSYGPVHDEKLRTDPKLRDYDKLNEEERAYYDRAWELLAEIAQQLKEE